MAKERLVELEDVAIGYDGRPLLRDIRLQIDGGDFFGLVGPNGAGKSTLLKAILGINRQLAGSINIKEGLRIGYVPQRSRLDPIYPLTTLEVVRAGGMGLRSPLKTASRKAALAALETAGLSKLAGRPMRDLSGGQQQRALIARALVRNPELLILDEPTAGMDIPSEHNLSDFISDLNRRAGLSVVLVAHQISLVAGRATKLAIINKDLSLFATGTAARLLDSAHLSDLYNHPMEVVGEGHNVIVRSLPCESCKEGS